MNRIAPLGFNFLAAELTITDKKECMKSRDKVEIAKDWVKLMWWMRHSDSSFKTYRAANRWRKIKK
jgi:hypothetical protein